MKKAGKGKTKQKRQEGKDKVWVGQKSVGRTQVYSRHHSAVSFKPSFQLFIVLCHSGLNMMLCERQQYFSTFCWIKLWHCCILARPILLCVSSIQSHNLSFIGIYFHVHLVYKCINTCLWLLKFWKLFLYFVKCFLLSCVSLRVCLNAWVLTPLLTTVGLKSEYNPEAAFYILILNCIQHLWLTMINKTNAFWPGKLLNSVDPYPISLWGYLFFQS